jgi:hypothetical protein
VNYHIIVKDGVGPLLTPLPIARLVKTLLNHSRSMCSTKVHHHRSIVQTLHCRSLTGRQLGLRVHQHCEKQILLCWNVMEISGFYKNCIKRELPGMSAVLLIEGLVERQTLVHAVCECVRNYSFLLVPSLYPLNMCIYSQWLDQVRGMLYPDDSSRQRRLMRCLSHICPRPVGPLTQTYTLCDVLALCENDGQSVCIRHIFAKLHEYVQANGFHKILQHMEPKLGL